MPKVFNVLSKAVRDIKGIYSGTLPKRSAPHKLGHIPPNVLNAFSTYGHSLSWHAALSEYLLMPRVTPVLEGALILASQLVPPRIYVKRYKDISRSIGMKRYLEALMYSWGEEGYNLSDIIRYLLQTGNVFLVRTKAGLDGVIDLWHMVPSMYVKIVYVVENEEDKLKFLKAKSEANSSTSPLLSSPDPVPVFKRYVIQYSTERVTGPILLTGTVSMVTDYQTFDKSIYGLDGTAAEILTIKELEEVQRKYEVYSPNDVIHIRWTVDMFDPYGTSIFEPIRFLWKQYLIMMQALIIWRLTNVVQRDIIFYPIGDKPILEAEQEIEEMKERLFGDWMSWGDEVLRGGSIKGFMSPIIVPYTRDRKPDIQTGETPPQRFREIADVEHFMYQLLAGIGMADIVSKASGASMQLLSLSEIVTGRSPTLIAIASRIQQKVQEMFTKIIERTAIGVEALGTGPVVTTKTIFEYGDTPPTSQGVFIGEEKKEEGEGGAGIGGIGGIIGGSPVEEEEETPPPPPPAPETETPETGGEET